LKVCRTSGPIKKVCLKSWRKNFRLYFGCFGWVIILYSPSSTLSGTSKQIYPMSQPSHTSHKKAGSTRLMCEGIMSHEHVWLLYRYYYCEKPASFVDGIGETAKVTTV